ncbi:InlB B-repeat-containing protein, partial [Cytobacillus sp. FJAT-54145]
TYDVTFDAGGGNVTPTIQTKLYDSTYGKQSDGSEEVLPIPTKAGHDFVGWYSQADGAGVEVTNITPVNIPSDHTLYAHWTAKPYTVTFDAGDGTVTTTTQTKLFGSTYGKGSDGTSNESLPTPTRTGYAFAGWYDNSGFTGSAITNQSEVTTANSHTLYAKWTAIPYYGTNPSTNSPTQEVITVPVEIGNVGSGLTLTQTPITRTTDQTGKIKDDVTFTSGRAKETVESVKQAGKDTARIVIPDASDKVSEVKVNVPKEATKELSNSNVNLEIYTENVRIIVPNQSFDGLEDDLFFRVVPIKEELKQKEVEERAKGEPIIIGAAQGKKVNLVSRPMTVETNMKRLTTTLILPLRDVVLPVDPVERETFLKELVVFIEHSDGEKKLVKADVVNYKDGLFGLQFDINKFSTFTILRLEGGIQGPTNPWGDFEVKEGQVGRIQAGNNTVLYKLDGDQLVYERVLTKEQYYRVYSKRSGLYRLGGNGVYIKQNNNVIYNTPSKTKLKQNQCFYDSACNEISKPLVWQGRKMNRGQIGGVDIVNTTELFQLNHKDEPILIRPLNTTEWYRVYGYIPPLYNVGGGYYVLQADAKYEELPQELQITDEK